MTRLVDARTKVVWAALVLLTVISWQLGTHGPDPRVATCVVVGVAFLKVRFIGAYFMELRAAPLLLRLLFEAYCAIVGGAVVGMYLFV